MATKKRISELPICETFKGLFTIGVDALNHSVKVSLEFIDNTVSSLRTSVETAVKNSEKATAAANTATNNANSATNNANTATNNANSATVAAQKATVAAQKATSDCADATEECREIIETASNLEAMGLFPTSMSLRYPKSITIGNKGARIEAVLYPERVHQNVICLSDNNALSVTPDGRITVLKIGTSTVHVLPTCNMALYRAVLITVTGPTVRLVTRSAMRFTSNGNIRFN